ncbi:MAG: M20/M25/M40 family metallo-hydrolase [Phycisphaerae bacterium]|nr:M20/M25/M40 family metallo-hydrolase [Gemmatimonadaceae bacterium]
MTETEIMGPAQAAIANSLAAANLHIQALDHKTLAQQRQVASVAAPTGAEGRRAAWVATALRKVGWTTRVDDAGNVIANTSARIDCGTDAPVICMAHLDTVFELDTALMISEDGTRISCPGIGDNGRGLAAMLTLAEVFVAARPTLSSQRRPLEFVATVGEEGLGNLRGARAYFANRAAHGAALPHAVVVLDGPGDEHIVHHALGSRRYRITFAGLGGHSWADFGTPNAVHAAARAAAMLSELPRSLNKRMALTVSGIGGGESVNSIPASAWIDVDVRGTDASLLARADSELRKIVQASVEQECANSARTDFARTARCAPGAGPLLNSQVTLVGERPCGALPDDHSLVRLASRVSALHGVHAISAIASTDANIPLSLGIPAITIGGGGSGGGAHTVNEWYDNTNGARGVQRAYGILATLAM